MHQDGGEAENCNYALSPRFASFPAAGGEGTLNVITGEECIWTATTSVSWIRITSNTSGLGVGAISYSVAANASAAGRSGTITIGGKTFAVKQKGG